MIIKPNAPIKFRSGAVMKNRFMLAPITNQQSFENGQLSENELRWLTMRAKGQFGIVMTCASNVQEIGKGFPGQLGIYSDNQIEGHKRLTANIREYGSLAIIQLHHAGMRSPKELIKQSPVCPSKNEKYGARALSLDEVNQLRNDFIDAARRAQKSGYDGVEIHGAHGYILTQFLSKEINKREDKYGGDLNNRFRIILEIIQGVRAVCGKDFMMGVRLSPERFGMDLEEVKQVCQQIIDTDLVDFLDISLWDCFKKAENSKYQNKSLLEHFTTLDFKKVLLTVAGKIRTGKDVYKILNSGVDFVTIGQSGILHHDFPKQVIHDADFEPIKIPVTENYLFNQGLSKGFINYMKMWPDFVK